MPEKQLGLWILIAGAVLIAIGFLVWLGAFSWFGRLPGDIRIERGGVRIYIPLATMLLLSLLLTLLLNLLRRLF